MTETVTIKCKKQNTFYYLRGPPPHMRQLRSQYKSQTDLFQYQDGYLNA